MAKDIENPCISVCQLSGDLCVSCGRTKDDIRKWRRMNVRKRWPPCNVPHSA